MSFLETGGRRYPVPVGEIRIGTDPSCQIVLAGDGVLAAHAIVQGYADGQVAIRRAADGAATQVNGVQLGPQPSPLLHGDKVQIGGHELLFVDERRSGSTVYVQAVDPGVMQGAKPGKKGQATAATGGRVVSLTDGREYAITGASMVFGRDASCDVVISDKNVSRRHCEIMVTPKGYVLVDSSTNGTFVNGERVEGQRLLARADVIRAGSDEFRFYADVAPAPPPPGTGGKPGEAAAGVKPPPPREIPAAAEAPPPGVGPEATLAERPAAAAAPASATAAPPGAAHRLNVTTAGIPSLSMPRPAGATPGPPAGEKTATTPPPPARPAGGVLANVVLRSGANKGQRIPIRVPIVNVGRADYNDVVLADESVSTTHAKIQRREGVWVLVDLDSTNGTFVDGERVSGETPLAPGALLRFGDVQAMFEPTDDTVDAAKGSSTKLMGAIKLDAAPRPQPTPGPPPAAPVAPPQAVQPAAPPPAPPALGAPSPQPPPAARPAATEQAAVAQKASATPSGAPRPQPQPPAARRPAPRPPQRPEPSGTPKWIIPVVVIVVLAIAALAFVLTR